MFFRAYIPALLLAIPLFQSLALTQSPNDGNNTTTVDLNWYPPNKTNVNDLSVVINGTGTGGFIFNTSATPEGEYGVYNWCNMPHVRREEYVVMGEGWELEYVEVVG